MLIMNLQRATATFAALAVGASLAVATPQTAQAADASRPKVQVTKSVPVKAVKAKASKIRAGKKAFTPTTLPKATGVKDVVVDDGWSDPVAGLGVRAPEGSGDSAVGIEVIGTSSTDTVASGPVYEITPSVDEAPNPTDDPSTPAPPVSSPAPGSPSPSADPVPSADPTADAAPSADPSADIVPDDTQLRLDYSEFANAYGGDWAGRLQLVVLDDCTVSAKKQVSCESSTPLESTNDLSKQTVTATLPPQKTQSATASQPQARSLMVAAVAGSDGAQGSYSASTLSPASSWSGGSQSGDFTWSYPLAAPPGINGPEPDLSIEYSSGSVDGRTSNTNNQTSWFGEGFDLDPGFIERSYQPCDDVSGTPADVGDLCWNDDEITIALNGKSSQLVRVGTSSQWRMKQDDGTRVERLAGGDNADDNGEYWRVTTTDGTEYYYGKNKRFAGDTRPTDSVSVVPVYGPDSGDACHDSTYASSVCNQAWRWGLDYVVDPNGNSMSVFWNQESNKYGSNKNTTVRAYDRAAVMTRIEYGTREGSDSTAPARMVFTTAGRCISTGAGDCDSLTESTASNWPDVPYDQICTSSSSCAGRTSPTFFSQKRLARVNTQVLGSDGSYAPVNEWVLTHELPSTGDTSTDPNSEAREVRTLWLQQIQQTGQAGTDVTLPPVTFGRTIMKNRVYDTNGVDSFSRFRVNAIGNGTGGTIAVVYSPEDCTASSKPADGSLDTNARRCFPVYYQPWWKTSTQLEFFHKYRVAQVTESDLTGGAAARVTNYNYGGGDGWHRSTSKVVKNSERTWNDWRGYSNVTTEVGLSSGKTFTNTLYMRGMSGDDKDGGNGTANGTKTVNVADALGDSTSIVDADQYAGFERRTRTQLGASGAVVDITVNNPWSSATATSGGRSAYLVDVSSTETRTRLATGSFRTTQTATTFDSRGRPTTVNDAGDTSTAADNRCTTTTYADNASANLYDYPATATTVGLPCGTAPTKTADIINASKIAYDGGSVGDAPTKGNPTTSYSAKAWADGAIDFQRDATTTYDAPGRMTSVTDARDRVTQTAYTPATGPVDSVTTTNPLGQTTVAEPNRQWGTPSRTTDVAGKNTDYTYDGLGRVTSVWGPDRDKSTQTPTAKFTYRVSATAPNAVTTERLNAAGDYVASVMLYDGLLRERESQAPSPGVNGGRVITEKIYDDRGWVKQDRSAYYNSAPVDTALVSADEVNVPSYTNLTYDLAGRVTKSSLASIGGIKWSTLTSFGGDRVLTTPPTGGTATTEVSDARGQLVTLTQHTAATPTGAGDVTSYTYTPAGQLKTVKDAAGSIWDKTYDIRGRLVEDKDPDKGTTTFTYDQVDQQVSSTDARGVTLWTKYDEIGRKIELRDDDSAGTLRSSWLYDTVRPGALTSSTRYVGDDQYVNQVNSYDDAGRVLQSRLRLPESEGALYRSAGYPTTTSYNPDGSVKQVNQPLVSDLALDNLKYTYDSLGNLKKLVGDVTFVSDVIYSPLGEVLQRTTGNVSGKSVYDTRSYDTATRRTTQRAVALQGSATTTRLDLRYTYDQAGNVTRLNDVASGDTAQSSTATWRQCFSYDYLRRLKNAWSSSTTACAAATTANLGTVAPYSDAYTYATNGNRTKAVSMRKPASAVTSTTRTSTFPTATAARPHAVSGTTAAVGSATETYLYDSAGNLAKRSTTASAGKTYEWDREGRVKQVTDMATGKNASYVYDADGNRILEKDTFDDSVTLHVGTGQFKLKDGVIKTVRTYTAGGESVAIRDSAGIRLTTTDHQGTPLISVNSNTLALDKRRYSPFGEQLQAPTATWLSNKGFLNKTTDSPVGTVHLDAREYDSAGGRFISVDPIAEPFQPQQLNGYAYALNSPVTESDPSGLRVDGGQGASYYGIKTSGSWCGPCQGAQFKWKKAQYKSVPVWRNFAAGIVRQLGSTFDAAARATPYGRAQQSAGKPQIGSMSSKGFNKAIGASPNSGPYTAGEWAFNLVPLPFLKGKWAADGLGAMEGAAVNLTARGAAARATTGWSRGGDIYALTKAGNKPAWSTVRGRFWKNEAANPQIDNWSSANLDRMNRGLAPQRYNRDKGGLESMDLSHEPIPYRDGGTSVVPRWPQDHAAIDPYRFPGY